MQSFSSASPAPGFPLGRGQGYFKMRTRTLPVQLPPAESVEIQLRELLFNMASGKRKSKVNDTITNPKLEALEMFREDGSDQVLTTNHGLPINDDQNSLKAGERGPTLLEDLLFREKMTHFDHERIPERVVHARGVAAHGVFTCYESMKEFTCADFLSEAGKETPVFLRFSTVAGSRGSADLARDVRGFAVRFYTDQGNFDLVGNNIPVFFVQDAHKFPDLIHAVKPEPHNEIPQAASAHDTFWDFISIMPESMHMIMWVMSDRSIPRSLRMMEGFGIHTFRFVNADRKAVFVKFHWKPMLGVHSVAWDEATKINGKDPDFHRRDLWVAIENGDYPEWELGVQIVPEEDEHKFDFDLLDSSKIIPEELVPVRRIGKMTLNRNPDNYFAETEQVAFHPGHIVPGIDFTNDPLLQGRLFSYIDTQISRLGGPNFMEIPINRPISPVHNNQRDGQHRTTINRGRSSYGPNTVAKGCPFQAMWSQGGFATVNEKVEGHKVRARSKSFFDHFSQATMFFNSLAEYEQTHMINALRFELGKVEYEEIRVRMLGLLSQVSSKLASEVAEGLGLEVPAQPEQPMNRSFGADADPADHQPLPNKAGKTTSPVLSQANTIFSAKTRQVAVLIGPGFDGAAAKAVATALLAVGAQVKYVGTRMGSIPAGDGSLQKVDFSLLNTHSVLFDALYVPGGADSVQTLLQYDDAANFVRDAYKHCKPVAFSGEGEQLLAEAQPRAKGGEPGVLVGSGKEVASGLPDLVAQARFWEREQKLMPKH